MLPVTTQPVRTVLKLYQLQREETTLPHAWDEPTEEEREEDVREDAHCARLEAEASTRCVPLEMLVRPFQRPTPIIICVGRDVPAAAKSCITRQMDQDLPGLTVHIDVEIDMGLPLATLQQALSARCGRSFLFVGRTVPGLPCFFLSIRLQGLCSVGRWIVLPITRMANCVGGIQLVMCSICCNRKAYFDNLLTKHDSPVAEREAVLVNVFNAERAPQRDGSGESIVGYRSIPQFVLVYVFSVLQIRKELAGGAVPLESFSFLHAVLLELQPPTTSHLRHCGYRASDIVYILCDYMFRVPVHLSLAVE